MLKLKENRGSLVSWLNRAGRLRRVRSAAEKRASKVRQEQSWVCQQTTKSIVAGVIQVI